MPRPNILFLLAYLLTIGALCCNVFAVELTKGGQPVAEIVIDAEAASPAVRFAGQELQLWIEKIF